MTAVESAIIGGVVGNLIVLTWAMWPMIVSVYRHGWDNHSCHRACCR